MVAVAWSPSSWASFVVGTVVVVSLVVVVGVVVVVGTTRWPTVIVTTDPSLSVPPDGDCCSTSPSWLGSVTSWVITEGLKPLCWISCTASDWLLPTTFGTSDVFGPSETVSVTFVPAGSFAPPPGSCAVTSSIGADALTSLFATLKPRPSSALLAFAYGCPTTFGTSSRRGPWETLIRTIDPFRTSVPPAGDSAVIVPVAACGE